jgi:hypothetical protein
MSVFDSFAMEFENINWELKKKKKKKKKTEQRIWKFKKQASKSEFKANKDVILNKNILPI